MNPDAHPNTVANLLTGTGGASLIVAALKYYGIDVSPESAILIAGTTGSTFLFIGRRGIRGTLRDLWRGNATPKPVLLAPLPVPPPVPPQWESDQRDPGDETTNAA